MSALSVERIVFPVTLSDGNTYSLVGHLYFHGTWRNRPLQVALHGGNYNHKYWDIPEINGRAYSYAQFMARRNHAVLALDLLGSGSSSKPDADFLSFQEMASAVHQVLASLRSGANPHGYVFRSMALVGHSLGSALAAYVQGTYRDADAVVSTGLVFVSYQRPMDPELIKERAKEPYFKLPPEVRRSVFHRMAGADPAVLDYDCTHLDDFIPRGYVFTLFPFLSDPSVTRVNQVTSPVLVQLGEFDALAPGSLAQQELAVWSGASRRSVQVVPSVGHCFNSHLANLGSWAGIDAWLSETLTKP
jgi:pimeloyl-ACP methyl ester carboxylesterase